MIIQELISELEKIADRDPNAEVNIGLVDPLGKDNMLLTKEIKVDYFEGFVLLDINERDLREVVDMEF